MKKVLSSRLRELRGTSSQCEFARKIGVKQTSYSGWESGAKDPASSVIALISTALGVSADWLLGISDDRRGSGTNGAAALKVAALEKRIEELEVRNRALIDALEAVGKGANLSHHSARAGVGGMSA